MKKNLIVKCLIPALMLGIATTAFAADDQAADHKPGQQKRAEIKKHRAELKNLTPEERAAKRKEMREKMEKRLGELRKKKTDGAITEKEEKQLERLEAMEKNAGKTPALRRAHKQPSEGQPQSGDKTQ